MDQDILKYVASAVDTSSYITIRMVKTCFVASVRIRRGDRELIDLIKIHFGGGIGVSRTPDGVPTFWINFNGKQAADFLLKIYPYLRRRKPHAQMVFAMAEEIRDHKKRMGRGRKLTEEEIKRRQHIFDLMKAFNHAPVITGPIEVKKEDHPEGFQELDFLL
jgi:hypothetical protein